MRSLFLLLMLVSAGTMAGGCATAGLALMGPLAGSLAEIADRGVERTIPADISTTWGATVDALARMAVRLDQTDKSGPEWRLTGTGEAVTVHGTLERVTAGMTKVSLRVEAGGLFADKRTGDELLNQIGASLARLANAGRRDGTTPGPDAESAQLRRLQHEIEKLGTKIEQAREAPPPRTTPGPSPVATVSPTPIIVIPASAGVPTLPTPDASSPRPIPPSAVERPALRRDGASRAPLQVAEPSEGHAPGIVAAPLRSVEVLRPVEELQIRPVRE